MLFFSLLPQLSSGFDVSGQSQPDYHNMSVTKCKEKYSGFQIYFLITGQISGQRCAVGQLQFGGQCPLTMRSILRLSTAGHWAHSTGRYDPLGVLNQLIIAIVGDGFPVPAVKILVFASVSAKP